jgi:phasin
MNTNVKTKFESANTDGLKKTREITETSAEWSREFFEKVGAATTEAAKIMQTCCSTALKGMQDYNNKVIEFTQTNTKSHADFLQKVAAVKSPSEFLEVSTEHARHQHEILAEQAKLLATLAQKLTLETAEPIKAGLAKTYDRAA